MLRPRPILSMPSEDRTRFHRVVHTELAALHEGNIARFLQPFDDVNKRVSRLFAVDPCPYDVRDSAPAKPPATGPPRLQSGPPARKPAVSDPDMQVLPSTAAPPLWSEEVEALRREWSGGLETEARGAMDAALESSKKGEGPFKKKQRTYTPAKAAIWFDKITLWLDSSPPLGSLPEGIDKLAPSGQTKQLLDPDEPFEHDAIDALLALSSLASAHASHARAEFVRQLRSAFEQLKQSGRVMTFQDLLRQLAQRLDPAVAHPDERAALASALGDAFDAALIDEFQDTDQHQWTVFREAFGQGQHFLYLIGDPKQAIYGFRGANVHVYRAARDGTGAATATMTINWRSDERLLASLNHLMDRPAFLGDVGFGYVEVHAPTVADRILPPGGFTEDSAAPLQLHLLPASLSAPGATSWPVDALRDQLARRVGDDIVALLDSDTQLIPKNGTSARHVGPRDIAVLVRQGSEAVRVQQALLDAGVPAVLKGGDSVMASEEARWVHHWLEAVLGGTGAGRALATTAAFGWTAQDLEAVAAEDHLAIVRWDGWLADVAAWRNMLRREGFYTAFLAALEQRDVVARLLALPRGDRHLSNLRHAAELTHRAAVEGRLAPEALLGWLERRRDSHGLERDELQLRLERDDEAVTILTMHSAKGLEFPVVFAPFLWNHNSVRTGDKPALVVPNPDDPTRRQLDVHVPVTGEIKQASIDRAEREGRLEGLRLLYVALTRARHRCHVYVGKCGALETSPLAAALFGESPDRLVTSAEFVATAEDEALLSKMLTLAAGAMWDGAGKVTPGPLVAVHSCEAVEGRVWGGRDDSPETLAVRTFTRRRLEPWWRRHSYSGLARFAGHGPAPTLPPELEGVDRDDVVSDRGTGAASDQTLADWALEHADQPEVPLAPLRGGADAGIALHAVLEHAAFAPVGEGDVTGLQATVEEQLDRAGFDVPRLGGLVTDGLAAAIRSPVGGPLGAWCLADLPRARRLDELRFDLTLAGGTRHGSPGFEEQVDMNAVWSLLASRGDESHLPPGWLEGLARLQHLQLAGFLTGAIDLVMAAPDPSSGGTERWFVVDYKSNRIDPRRTGRVPSVRFGQAGLHHEMAGHRYVLQYHLYLIALHRYLRWRLGPSYDYDTHIGGAYYLFLRGMLGPDAEGWEADRARGVYFDRPPRGVIEGLDAAFGPGLTGGGAP